MILEMLEIYPRMCFSANILSITLVLSNSNATQRKEKGRQSVRETFQCQRVDLIRIVGESKDWFQFNDNRNVSHWYVIGI